MSNTGQKRAREKTKLARKLKPDIPFPFLLAVIFGIILGLVLAVLIIRSNESCMPIGRQCFNLQVADSASTRRLGLSGKSSVNAQEGMLFIFDKPNKHCMWMKDMKFPLDIIWLDSGGKVVQLRENISPDTYPQTFCPQDETEYIIELNAGQIAKSGLRIGDRVMIN